MKKLVIEIKQATGGSSGSKAIDEAEGSTFQKDLQKKISNIQNPIGAAKSKINDIAGAKGLAVAGAVIAVSQEVLGQVSASVNFAISGVGMATGDSSLQENIAREQEKINESLAMVKGTAGGAGAGAIMGAAFGPLGAVVGAVAGAVFGGITKEMSRQRKYEERRREYEYEAWKFDTARSINLQRAGVTIGSGRLHQY